MRLPAWLQRLLAPSYGCCGRCRRPWKFVNEHVTYYGSDPPSVWLPDERRWTGTRGCFALCKRCWRELETPLARMPYYHALHQRWILQGSGREWWPIERAVYLEAARERYTRDYARHGLQLVTADIQRRYAEQPAPDNGGDTFGLGWPD